MYHNCLSEPINMGRKRVMRSFPNTLASQWGLGVTQTFLVGDY